MESTLRIAVVGCIRDAGLQLRKWVSVLDEIASVQALMTPEVERALPPTGRLITDTTLELALSITQAYARAFDRFVEYGMANGLSSTAPELLAVAQYKGLIDNPRALFEAMCHQHATAAEDN